MIKRVLHASKIFPSLFKQSRSFSYIYNGLQWGEQYPGIPKSASDQELSLDQVLGDVKGKKPKYLSEVTLPYNFKGTKPFKPLKRAFDNLILNQDRVDLARVNKKLHGYVNQYLNAISTGNLADLPPCESNFIVAVNRGLHLLNNGGFRIEQRESPHEVKEKGLKEGVEIFETMHILGLNVERAMNNSIEDYLLDNQYEGRGLLVYFRRPTKSTVLEEEVQKQERKKLRIQQGLSPDEEQDLASEFPPDLLDFPSMRGHLKLDPEEQMILRVYALVTTSKKLVPIQDGKEAIGLDDYSFRHVAIFESQLRRPPVGSMTYMDKESTLSKYRLQGWKLVDFDGVMRGNPLLLPKAELEKLYLLKPE